MASRRTLERLLDRRNDHPEQLAQIDAQIRAQFEQSCAILVLDMCGFSRLTTKHGIIHYLSLIRRMQRVVVPRIAEPDALNGRGLVIVEALSTRWGWEPHDGGKVVFEGTPAALIADATTLTGQHLAAYVGV